MKKLFIKPLGFSIFIAFLGFLGSYYVSMHIGQQFTEQSYVKLDNIAKQVSIRFQDAIDQSLNDVQAIQAFYTVNKQHYSLNEFNKFMDILDIENKHYIHALCWIPLVKHKDRAEFESLIKAQQGSFYINERDSTNKKIISATHDYYLPVTYVSSTQLNKTVLGFNLNSNHMRRTSLEKARDIGKLVISSRMKLIQNTEESFGYLLIAPIYDQSMAIDTIEQRRKAIVGYATGVFRVNTLIAKTVEQAHMEGLEVTLTDLNEDTGGVLYGKENNSNNAYDVELIIPNRDWLLTLVPNELLLEKVENPLIVKLLLFSGFFISLLFSFIVYALCISIKRSSRIRKLSEQLKKQNSDLENIVKERTEKLADKNTLLSNNIQQLEEQSLISSRLMVESQEAKNIAELKSKALARSNEDLDSFAYIASHDLKAPLRGIDQLASWVQEDIAANDFDEVSEHLNMMRSRVNRLEKLLDDLLQYSRINKQISETTLINTYNLTFDLFTLLAPPSYFRLTVDDNLPTFETLLMPFEQVLRNLLSNAIKHHNKKDAHIHVSCTENEHSYIFGVCDNGEGIDAKYHQDIFKMFRTLKPRDETEGSGMGLAMIKKITERYNGDITLKSNLGEGTTFYFTWPKKITSE